MFTHIMLLGPLYECGIGHLEQPSQNEGVRVQSLRFRV